MCTQFYVSPCKVGTAYDRLDRSSNQSPNTFPVVRLHEGVLISGDGRSPKEAEEFSPSERTLVFPLLILSPNVNQSALLTDHKKVSKSNIFGYFLEVMWSYVITEHFQFQKNREHNL